MNFQNRFVLFVAIFELENVVLLSEVFPMEKEIRGHKLQRWKYVCSVLRVLCTNLLAKYLLA